MSKRAIIRWVENGYVVELRDEDNARAIYFDDLEKAFELIRDFSIGAA